MADVFISYRRTDRLIAEAIAKELNAIGMSVWYDADLVTGVDYREQTQKALEGATVVLAVWTNNSKRSLWVLDEAMRAAQRGRLLSVRAKNTEVPKQFRNTIAVTLSSHNNVPTRAEMKEIIDFVSYFKSTVEKEGGDILRRMSIKGVVYDLVSTAVLICMALTASSFSTTSGNSEAVRYVNETMPLIGIFVYFVIGIIVSPVTVLISRVGPLISRRLLNISAVSYFRLIVAKWVAETFAFSILTLTIVVFGTSKETATRSVEIILNYNVIVLIPFMSMLFVFLTPKYIPLFFVTHLQRALLR